MPGTEDMLAVDSGKPSGGGKKAGSTGAVFDVFRLCASARRFFVERGVVVVDSLG